ncbi:MAG: amidohydrolase family protein [Anaerolineae bacterium]
MQDFRNAGVEAVLVAFDIETAAGTPPCSNDYVVKMRDNNPGVILQAWAAVDPLKGQSAIDDARKAISDLGMLGFHFHPIVGHFSVDDRQLYPLWETINELRVPVMIDVGTTGMGAGTPGGLGAIIRHAHPSAIDRLAADFPDLSIVAAHPGWPWTEEMIAVALHKGNVSWELSGWAPKYFPEALRRDIKSRLQDKIMFGSDYPSIPYERLFREWHELGYSEELMEKVFHGNAERILGL